MRLSHSLVTAAFVPPAEAGLDFDAVRSPRALRPRPVEADHDALRSLRATLAWFWNTNPEWADRQIVIADRYSDAAAVLLAGFGLAAGDRIVLSASEPHCRRTAWKNASPDGVLVSDWRPRGCGRLFLEDLEGLLGPETRLVVLTKACPVTGALNEVVPFAQRLAGSGVELVVEASHFAAHGPLDIRNLRCGAVIAAADELFGAQGAALWIRRRKDRLPGGPPRVANLPAEALLREDREALSVEGSLSAPSANGLVSPETVTGLLRMVAYAGRLGEEPGAPAAPPSERFFGREAMRRGMQSIRHEERILSRRMLSGLSRSSGLALLGEADPRRAAYRTPTFTFGVEGRDAADLGAALEDAGARVASGDLGARTTLEGCGRDPAQGVVRASLAHYHREQDIDRFLETLDSVLRGKSRPSPRSEDGRGRRIAEGGWTP